jgi:predicted nucleic acid-binding protein
VYVDTSFLVSLYTPDANSIPAAQIMQASRDTHVVSVLTELECINALQLRVFRKEISAAQAKSSLRSFESDVSQRVFQLVHLPEEAFRRAGQISRQTTPRLGIRSADLLHVAAALELKADALYSFDDRQRKLARSLRLKVNRQV